MDFYRVANWDDLQHYKDREPKWIKVYRAMLNDYKINQLSDAEFGQLVKIWLLASQLNNAIPADEKWISQKISASEPLCIGKLISLGFLECYNEDGESVPIRTEVYVDKSREDKIREEYTPEFERFWSTFRGRWDPDAGDGGTYVKAGKWTAFEEWGNLSAADQKKATAAAPKVKGKYTPDACRWLNRKMFDDFKGDSK